MIETQHEIVQKAYKILISNRYLSLATTSGQLPWIAPVYYAVDAECKLYFESETDSLHTTHILHRPDVAVAVFNSTEPPEIVDGLQIRGVVGIVEEGKLSHVIDVYYKKRFPSRQEREAHLRRPEDYTGKCLKRFFEIEPIEVYKVDLSITVYNRRVSVPLEELRKLFAV